MLSDIEELSYKYYRPIIKVVLLTEENNKKYTFCFQITSKTAIKQKIKQIFDEELDDFKRVFNYNKSVPYKRKSLRKSKNYGSYCCRYIFKDNNMLIVDIELKLIEFI